MYIKTATLVTDGPNKKFYKVHSLCDDQGIQKNVPEDFDFYAIKVPLSVRTNRQHVNEILAQAGVSEGAVFPDYEAEAIYVPQSLMVAIGPDAFKNMVQTIQSNLLESQEEENNGIEAFNSTSSNLGYAPIMEESKPAPTPQAQPVVEAQPVSVPTQETAVVEAESPWYWPKWGWHAVIAFVIVIILYFVFFRQKGFSFNQAAPPVSPAAAASSAIM